MKKLDKLFTLLLVAVMVITISTSAFAEEYSSKVEMSEVDKLKADIASVENVKVEDLQEFYKENQEWIEDVNTRLEEYLKDIPEDQKHSALREVLGSTTSEGQIDSTLGELLGVAASGSVYDYFNSVQYHFRGGYWTYSMAPKTATRLWAPTCQAGWVALGTIFSGIRNAAPGSSLHDQYWCHFDALIEANWDIEVGRPDVSYLATLWALCNP